MTFSKLPVPVTQLVDEGSTNEIHTPANLPEKVKSERLAQIAKMVAAQAWWWSSNT